MILIIENSTFYFPIVICIIISLALTIFVNLAKS
ncbi:MULTISPECIES: DUF2905 family protein [Prochlorococcus]|uniref:Uncharacterized protein n=1 Tax=Prochlorococcus marinus (strain SARG / CCMP1375 / SS120) TaxID=167539 RepID=Q7VCT4_PROMA|nr:Predicted protein [Prochlorococcus marinus subsp. marinus str. CCMP1375]